MSDFSILRKKAAVYLAAIPPRAKNAAKFFLLAGCAAVSLAGCSKSGLLNTGQTYNEGYIIDQQVLGTIVPGSPREQVMMVMGSPSLTAMYDNEVFYYISQTRHRGAQFMKPKIVDRRVVAVYFDKNNTVAKVAQYGMKDGKLFDFASKTTPTGGKDQSFLNQLIMGTRAVPALPIPQNPR